MVLLRIRSSSGAEGLGEAVPLSLRGGDEIGVVVQQITHWAERALEDGQPADLPISAPARCAVLTALADAEAREASVPLHNLLDPHSGAHPIRCNATLSSGTAATVAADAARWAEDGFTTFKLKVGPGSGVEQVSAVRNEVGSDALIRVDANGSWPPEVAGQLLRELEPFGIELAEQPVAGLEGMAGLRSRTAIPLVADEAVSNSDEASRAASIGACDAITVKLSKTGSLDPRLGGALPTYVSSALDGPVGIAAAAHVAMTLPQTGPFAGTAQGLATGRLFAGSIAVHDPPLEGPWLSVPEGPGLGIEIDQAALRRCRL
jgi:L-alanine-DL-glutamate epimerase-like enolase superfamily enzyme